MSNNTPTESKIILIPEPGREGEEKKFKISIPEKIVMNPGHFPQYFPADYPAIVTDKYVREILGIVEKTEEPFHVFIDLKDFIENEYPWIPYTLALHTLILAPKARVYFRGMDPVEFSEILDERNKRGPMECIRNFCVYLNTTKGDRPGRVYEQDSAGNYVSFWERIFRMMMNRGLMYSPYYAYWLNNPFHTGNGEITDFVTHPYDHLPVRNKARVLTANYFTKTQWKQKGYTVPGIDKAVFLHDQLGTVVLRPYWSSSVVIQATKQTTVNPLDVMSWIRKDGLKS